MDLDDFCKVQDKTKHSHEVAYKPKSHSDCEFFPAVVFKVVMNGSYVEDFFATEFFREQLDDYR